MPLKYFVMPLAGLLENCTDKTQPPRFEPSSFLQNLTQRRSLRGPRGIKEPTFKAIKSSGGGEEPKPAAVAHD
jgi:hypothetical protein